MKTRREPDDDQPRLRITERRDRSTVVVRVLGSALLQERRQPRAVCAGSVEYHAVRRPQAAIADGLRGGQSFGAFDGP